LTAPRATGRVNAPSVRRVLAIILCFNIIVVAVKIYVGAKTGALTVLGAALESSLDMLNNVIGMVLVTLAARGPDEDHPYGHEKFETVGALAIVGFLSISCFELLRRGVEQWWQGAVPRPAEPVEIALLVATVLVNLWIVWYERRKGRELGSAFLLADAAHTSSDTWVTLLAITSLLLTNVGYGAIDPLLAILVALIIARSGLQILRGTIPVLVDERGADAEEIRRVVLGVAGILEVRSIRSRATPSGLLLAEITVGVSATQSVADAHLITDEVEERIAEVLGDSEVIVHAEPA
jgi:cation diffusion facilitator family transporter